MTIRILGAGLGFITANYIYQAFGAHDWSVATERSFFQALPLAWIWVSLTFTPMDQERDESDAHAPQ